MTKKITIADLQAKKNIEKIVALTAYDYSMARIEDESGVDIVLVGDSLGMVIMGREDTLSVTMMEMIHHTRAVTRACLRAFVVADMPFLSYGVETKTTLHHAGSLIKKGGAHAVKIEGGLSQASSIKAMTSLGIPVLAHIGMTPTHVHQKSGYHVQGKGKDARALMFEDAHAVEEAGAFAVVLECIPAELAREITAALRIPTIGIGAGPFCDGQILVAHDMLGMYHGKPARFVKKYAELHHTMMDAFAKYQ
ncbi:MAG: 3-methyl-2-oxobutanoate hydroxymethyltransferase, partial [Chlamydiota bacterium]|nr:3-methyl-2-oxobutanoate hydroxymethyltransferase [Chlamydiota bacterium]